MVSYTTAHGHQLTRASNGSAGWDICAGEAFSIAPGEYKLVKTGISLEMPETMYARVAPRSGLAYKHGINVLAGVIDSDYRGDVGVILINHGSKTFSGESGDRIAQLVFTPVYNEAIHCVGKLSGTERGEKGFGSSGVSHRH